MPPAERTDDNARRSVVPQAAGRSLWLAAAWTGVGAAVVCATLALVVVSILWLPASNGTGRTNSTIRAGLLTFLSSLHGGITVADTHAQFLPLGMLVAVAITTWRAGCGLADVADSLDEQDPVRLALASLAQTASFVVVCLFAVPFAQLGTSSAPFVGVGVAAFVLFALTGGVAFIRWSALSAWAAWWLPDSAGRWVRMAAAVIAVYLGSGALLVAASVVLHRGAVETISHQVGNGWGGIPLLLLGILAAPNAAIAGASYLAGPGFAVGSGTSVALLRTTHGTVPAFPLFGALPHGPAGPAAWGLAVATPLLAGLVLTRLALRATGWARRIGDALVGLLFAGIGMATLGWQGGGAIGADRLRSVGASPWQLGGAVLAAVTVVALPLLAITAGWRAVRGTQTVPARAPSRRPAASRTVAAGTAAASATSSRAMASTPSRRGAAATVPAVAEATPDADADGTGKLAG